jgi:hypothetical protein
VRNFIAHPQDIVRGQRRLDAAAATFRDKLLLYRAVVFNTRFNRTESGLRSTQSLPRTSSRSRTNPVV